MSCMRKYSVGVDFGTLSARALLVELDTGDEIATSVFEYPHKIIEKEFNNKKLDNSYAFQHPQDYIDALSYTVKDVVEKSGIDRSKKVNSITKDERKTLLNLLKHLTFTVKGYRPVAEAIVTSGGINVKEINASTMESKIVDGLYFAGEVIDVDAYTGGFNLQIAFSTGYLAGDSAAEKEFSV